MRWLLCLFSHAPTVREYGDRWIERRAHHVISFRDERGQLANHVYPRIGFLPMGDVTPRHIRDLVLELRASNVHRRGTGVGQGTSTLAPRTVRHVYAVLRRMFKSAVIDEVIGSNPVLVEPGVLPKNVDKDPAWRATAVFERSEVIQLVSNQCLPHKHRVLNALKALAGLRHGEAAGLRWRDHIRELRPLGKLVVARSYDRERTKTQIAREVPVHPVLANLLRDWRDEGWPAAFGRVPDDGDLIIPGKTLDRVWRSHCADNLFADDLVALGMRHRRGHDLRRTFITLAQLDGARRELLKVITHGPALGDIVGMYTSFPWPALCAEVGRLEVSLT